MLTESCMLEVSKIDQKTIASGTRGERSRAKCCKIPEEACLTVVLHVGSVNIVYTLRSEDLLEPLAPKMNIHIRRIRPAVTLGIIVVSPKPHVDNSKTSYMALLCQLAMRLTTEHYLLLRSIVCPLSRCRYSS